AQRTLRSIFWMALSGLELPGAGHGGRLSATATHHAFYSAGGLGCAQGLRETGSLAPPPPSLWPAAARVETRARPAPPRQVAGRDYAGSELGTAVVVRDRLRRIALSRAVVLRGGRLPADPPRHPKDSPMTTHPTPVLLTYAFRPFFLLAAAYAQLAVLAWLAFLFAGLPLPLGWSPLQWHSHEMLYGFVTAAIAGFLLTAICNWTGASPLSGGRLLGLILLWLAGRIAFWLAGWLPAWLVATVDLLFLPVLTLYVLKVLLAHGNRRNLILVAALSALTLGNVLMHAGFTSGRMDLLKLGQSLGLDVITLLMVVIAGRITPAFSANWLRAQGGNPEWVTQSAWVTRLAI